MADNDSIRQRIISTVFSRRNNQGIVETYAGHLKIWEDSTPDEGGGRKTRYILLSQTSNGSGCIHKSKLNTNGSFSVGKTWSLEDLRGVDVYDPTTFSITLARTYRWTTDSPIDQTNFIIALVRLFRNVTRGTRPLQLVGLTDPDAPRPQHAPQPPMFTRMERAPTPPNGAPVQPATPRRPFANGHAEASAPINRSSNYSEAESSNRTSGWSARSVSPPPIPMVPPIPPTPKSRSRRPVSPAYSRPDSASESTPPPPLPTIPVSAGILDRSSTASRNRPSTPSSQQPPPSAIPPSLRPRHTQTVSNASSNGRSSPSTTSSKIPSVILPEDPYTAISVPTSLSIPEDYRSSGPSSAASSTLDVPSIPDTSSVITPTPQSSFPKIPDTPRARGVSPAPSTRSRKYTAVPSNGDSSAPQRREGNARVSFYDPANQATLDKLLSGDAMFQWDKDGDAEGEGADGGVESNQATLASVEEMLEGYEWASDDMLNSKMARGTADQIEARLLDELMALEKANIHSFIETDDRVNTVLQYLSNALAELDTMDSTVASYRIHLNAVSDDIAYIQSQNRGLQVQTQNQRTLLDELEQLLQTVQVDREALLTLTQESLEKSASIERLEGAATQLYKALQASRDRDMAATMERLEEYKTHNAQFCKRLFDFLSIMFTAQSKLLLGDNDAVIKSGRGRPTLRDHRDFETYLARYCGLIVYLKEMDESVYAKLCAAYFSAASELHKPQMKTFFIACSGLVKKGTDEDDSFGVLSPVSGASRAAAGVRRAGTIVRSPLEGRRDRKEQADGDLRASDAFAHLLDQIAPLIYKEEQFIADFLQINDDALTFADYAGLDNYFRRQASRSAGLSTSTMKLVHGAMDLIFGFLPTELKGWLDNALIKDTLQIVGLLVCLERFLTDAEERGNAFFINVLEKQHTRLKAVFDRRIAEHIKSIEDTKLTSKKRNGVAGFVKYFPTYIGRIENQLIGADTLEIRQHVDLSYDKIVQSMFDSLKQMAKMDDGGEDKGQLNYHVILIENMHHFVAEVSRLDIGSVAAFLQRAEAIYDENLNAYVKIALRRPFAKIIDYFEGVERLLKTTAPSEVSSNGSYSKSALKKVVKEFTTKDIRKHVDALFKRVEKHFTEASEKTTTEEVTASTGIAPGTVMVGVWKSCEEELLRITELFSKRIAQCYQSAGVTLEYSAGDVEAAFKRHRVAS